MKNLTPPQAEILRLLCTGTGKYAYRNVSDDLVWETGEPKSGYFAQGIDFEPLCGLKEIGEWRINSLALRSLMRLGYCDNEGITPLGREASHSTENEQSQ